jgi:Matrixin
VSPRPTRHHLALLGALLLAAHAQAVPSGRRWALSACTTSCPPTMQCVANRCLPLVRAAASVDNLGGTTLTGGVPYATFLARLPEDFRTWTAPRVTACATTWDVTFGAGFAAPQGTTAVSGSDSLNAVIWLTGSAWRYSASTLALTTTTYYTGSNEIFDADMELNNNVAWATDGSAGAYDLDSVVTHEAGHFLGLDHTPASYQAVMFPNVVLGQEKRQLAVPDTADVCQVYPGGPGSLGSPCTTGGACLGGLVCEGAGGATALTCVQDCQQGGTCPAGWSCQASTAGFACLPQVGVPDQCKFCSGGADCSTGVCLLFQATGVSFCSQTCTSASQCSPGSGCTDIGSGSFCLPTATCTNQCTTAAQCPVDYACTGGACVPLGTAGKRCELSGFCAACDTCVADASGTLGFCRACCGASTAGGTQCTGCAATTCDTGLSCATLSSGDAACLVPQASTLPGLCQACATTGDACATGYTCLAGRCHAGCNLANPGACAACLDTGNNVGLCACPDEVASAGQPCGNVAGGAVAGCGAGLACVGAPQRLCRAVCTLNDASTCPADQACQLVGGVAVCLPGSAGNTCAPCTNTGGCNTGLSCYSGRCYAPCNVNVAGCATCVETAVGGTGVCACPDQLAAVGEACGSQPQVRSCVAGSLCLDGLCRARCDPANPTSCPVLTQCLAAAGSTYCLDPVSGAGGGGGTGGGSGRGGGHAAQGGGTGGSGAATTSNQGCGCSTLEPSAALLLAGLLPRRRRVRR